MLSCQAHLCASQATVCNKQPGYIHAPAPPVSSMIGSLLMADVVDPTRNFFTKRFGKKEE
jgi:hypothetical protein